MDSTRSSDVKVKNPLFLLKAGFIFPLILLALYAPWSGPLDLWVSHQFYHANGFENSAFLDAIYHYAIFPGWILAGVGILGLLFSFVKINIRKRLRIFLFLILTLGIGSGVIVHALLKDHWGRPRPRQTTEFGGTQPFSPFYQPNVNKQVELSKSFPCGHCTMGFYFFTLMFLGVAFRDKKLLWAGLLLAIGLGGLLGYARIAQGGHFFSDVLVSGIIMWCTALILYCYLIKNKSQRLQTGDKNNL
jgi:membrane-associated PAP2 superfamily phosphatase